MGHKVSVITTQLRCCSLRTAIDNTLMNGHGSVPIKNFIYKNKEPVVKCSLLPLELEYKRRRHTVSLYVLCTSGWYFFHTHDYRYLLCTTSKIS